MRFVNLFSKIGEPVQGVYTVRMQCKALGPRGCGDFSKFWDKGYRRLLRPCELIRCVGQGWIRKRRVALVAPQCERLENMVRLKRSPEPFGD